MPALLLRFMPHLGLAALLGLAGLGLALKIQTARLEKARTALSLEKALHETDIANFKAAQALANAEWQAEIGRLTANNRRQKDEADRQAGTTAALYHDRVLRIPAATATACAPANADLPGARLAKSFDRSGADAVLLARTDTMICAENSARLRAAHDWAQALLASTPRPASTSSGR